MRKENDLGRDNVFRLLLKLTIPSMMAQFVNVLYSIVDRIFISNIQNIGDLALAGVGVCIPIVTLITSFCYLVGLGGAPLVAIKLGEGNRNDAQKILSNCFIMLMILSIVLTALCLGLKDYLLKWFGASDNIMPYAKDYFTIYISGSIFAVLSLGLNIFITCQGFSKIAMASVLVSAVLNIGLDPLFIFTFNMGVKGGALATVISQAVSCVWIVMFLMGKRTSIRLSFKGFNFKTAKKIILLGLSPFLIMATESVIVIALNSSLRKYGGINGDSLIASATIVVCFMQLIILPLGGITMGAQPIMSYNYGAKNLNRIKQAFKGLVVICFIFNAVMFALSMTIPHLFAKIFSDNPDILAMSAKGIRVYTSGILFLSLQYPCVDTLTALGSAKYAIFLSLFRKLGILLTLTLVLPVYFGAESVFWAEAIADAIGGTLSIVIFGLAFKKILKKRESELIIR